MSSRRRLHLNETNVQQSQAKRGKMQINRNIKTAPVAGAKGGRALKTDLTIKSETEQAELSKAMNSDDTLLSLVDQYLLNAGKSASLDKAPSNEFASTTSTTSSTISSKAITNTEDDNEFAYWEELDCDLQCTQKFLADIEFKIPHLQLDRTQEKTDTINSSRMSLTQIFSENAFDMEDIRNDMNDVQTNLLPEKGDFYGLPDNVRQLICKQKSIDRLYDWQDECLRLPAVQQRRNLVYALPTSGGKTLVAEILMLRELICREKNVLFILPFISLVQEKVSAMSPLAISLNFIVDEYTAGKGKCPPVKRHKRKSIYVASIEKGAILLDSLIEAKRVNEIGLVVVDELHLIGERGRGATLEALLTKIIYLKANIQIVGMSATIGNLSEISEFLKADVYTSGFRPVQLKEYIKCGRDLLEINPNGKSLEEIFIYQRSINLKYDKQALHSDPDHLAALVIECSLNEGCLIFCPSRKNCENVARLLCKILPKSKFLENRRKEKADLIDALEKICGVLCPVLAETIPYGVAYHHSGLTIDERKFIESAYRLGVLSVICCTSTLAAGVNLPAKRVIIRAPYVGSEFITICKYKQMVGRAGRTGFGTAGESILIASSRDNVQVGRMLFAPMDKAISLLDHQDQSGLQTLIQSAIGLGVASCRNDLYRLACSTLWAVQLAATDKSSSDVIEIKINNILKDMFKSKIVELVNASERNANVTSVLSTQDSETKNSTINKKTQKSSQLVVGRMVRFQLTRIGKAAFKAGIDYNRAFYIHQELQNAQNQMILSNYSHLLYIVVAFNSNSIGNELFSAEPTVLFRSYERADKPTRQLFKLVGFNDAYAVKMMKNMTIEGPLQLQLNRLYKVLIIMDILKAKPLPAVANKYQIERGILQNLITQTISAANSIIRLCEEITEFWCFPSLFEHIARKIDCCCTMELEPLLDLPAVKLNRAKQLYAAGYKTIADLAKVRPIDLVRNIAHMPMRTAMDIVNAAKISLIKKWDFLEEETDAIKVCLAKDNIN